MKQTVILSELATATGKHETTIRRALDKKNCPYTWRYVRGGRCKYFFVSHLPESYRIALARANVSQSAFTSHNPNATAGAIAGAKVAQTKAINNEKERIKKERLLARFHEYSIEEQEKAYARRDVLLTWQAYVEQAGCTRKKATQYFCRHFNEGEINLSEVIRKYLKTVSWSNLKRWQAAYKEKGITGLVNGYCNPNKGATSLGNDQQDFAVSMIVKYPDCSLKMIMDAMATRFTDLPSYSTVRRFLRKWKTENKSLYLLMTNPDAWKSKHMYAAGDASEKIIRLNQVWEFDSTPADVMLADGRHSIIGVIDVFTRRFKLLVSKTSKSSAVAALVRRAILDWGVPEIAKTDNGSDYVSNHITQVFETLEIEQLLCPPFTPEAKPHIERAFRTFSHSIAPLLPGYIGHNVSDRKAIEARKSFADRLMKREEIVEIKMTAEELQTLCDRWCNAMYHQEPHRSLDNKSPVEVARIWQGVERRIEDERALDILLAEVPGNGGVRTVRKKGVRVDRIRYFSEEIASLAGQDVRVKLDKTDLGTIYLFSEDWKYLGAAYDPLRKGLDRAEEAAKLKATQKKLMSEGRKELKKLVRKQALDNMHERILEHREAEFANVIEFPKPSETYTTNALEEAGKAAEAVMRDRREDRAIDNIIAQGLLATEQQEQKLKPVVNQKKKNSKVVPIFTTKSDQYNWIKTRERKIQGLTQQEYDWLTEYYKEPGGMMYLTLEGDLREKMGLRNLVEAEG